MTHFSHRPQDDGATIAAIATPPGEGGVAIVRISGKDAIAIADRVFSGSVTKFASHTAHYGRCLAQDGSIVDDVLLLPMRAPNSYTAEDVVEIHCHGGGLVTRRVLETVLQAGARAAGPGEFTLRAFLNGRIDLAQAEAVQELIGAKNEYALQSAANQLEGHLSAKVDAFQQRLLGIAAILEAWVDFPEEGLEFASLEELDGDLAEIVADMGMLAATFYDGQRLREGINLCLAGTPNVGKSSLLNRLVQKERAIVTPLPGTTRDLLEEQLLLAGVHVHLTDTAGIRTTEETIEKEGIRRSREAIEKSDLILLVLDCSRPLADAERALIEEVKSKKTLALWNKCDLAHGELPALPFPQTLKISAQTGVGIEALKEAIFATVWKESPPSKEEVLITKIRHKEALEGAITSLQAVRKGLLEGLSPEFLMVEMRHSLAELGQILGLAVNENILDEIFLRFCIGK